MRLMLLSHVSVVERDKAEDSSHEGRCNFLSCTQLKNEIEQFQKIY
jgi:hypothetical protein